MKIRKRKKYLKKRKKLVDQVVAILDDIDPVHIISSAKAAGFDIDREYVPEAEEIVLRIEQWDNINSMQVGLRRIFDFYFYYPGVPQEYYQIMARKIWNIFLANRGKKTIEFPDDIKLSDHPPPILINID